MIKLEQEHNNNFNELLEEFLYRTDGIEEYYNQLKLILVQILTLSTSIERYSDLKQISFDYHINKLLFAGSGNKYYDHIIISNYNDAREYFNIKIELIQKEISYYIEQYDLILNQIKNYITNEEVRNNEI